MKKVRVTIELPERFVRLLHAKANFSRWTEWGTGAENPPEMDAGSVLGWLILQEARGATEDQIHASTPMMWRDADGPLLIHDERRVYEDGKLIGGKK